jgi:CheY-like chemotaxis protein
MISSSPLVMTTCGTARSAGRDATTDAASANRTPQAPLRGDDRPSCNNAHRLPDGSGRTVLIVDDNIDAADSLATLLEASGYTVAVAHDGPAALAAVQEWAPDYALLDIGMPSMDGYELAAHLRFQPGGEATKVIAITGHDQAEDVRRSKAKGFADHLVKPVDLRRLASLLN